MTFSLVCQRNSSKSWGVTTPPPTQLFGGSTPDTTYLRESKYLYNPTIEKAKTFNTYLRERKDLHHPTLKKANTLRLRGRGGGVRPFTLKKKSSKAKTRPDIFRVVLCPYMQYCPREASEQKLEQKQKSGIMVIELSDCHHSICLQKMSILKKNFKIG